MFVLVTRNTDDFGLFSGIVLVTNMLKAGYCSNALKANDFVLSSYDELNENLKIN